MTLFASFATTELAAARMQAENSARGEVYFGSIYAREEDDTVVLSVDATFTLDALLPHADAILEEEEAAAEDYEIPGKDSVLQAFQSYQKTKSDELLAACHAFEAIHFSGPAHSVINSLNDLSFARAINTNDGSYLSTKAIEDLVWISTLWTDYNVRKYMVYQCTTRAAVDAISGDYSNNGTPPHPIFDVQAEYNTLLGTLVMTLPNVDPDIKTALGLPT